LVDRTRAANQQRSKRNQLALAIGSPGELPDNVTDPDLAVYDRPVPDYDELLEVVLEQHPLMAVNNLLLEGAEQTIRQYEVSGRPELLAQLEATEWSLETGNRDQYIAGLQLNIPLGGRSARRAKVAEAVAERHRLQADRRALEFELRQEVLELIQRLQEIQVEIEAAQANELYRDLYLDRSRTLYQLEVRSDLGDSQARQAEAVWRSAKARFERALTWARIDAMRGLPQAILNSEESQ
jgi:outer membrane protein TolC